MDAADFRREIHSAHRLLAEDLGLVRTTSSLQSLKVSPAFNEVALSPECNYGEIYKRALSISHYNFALFDFALFQYSWVDEDSWRLAFLPNPWITGVPDAHSKLEEWETLETLGAFDDIEIGLLISELEYHHYVPPFRFEYSLNQYHEISHPAAHIHIGRHTENRWPFSKALAPLSFTLMIVKMYYNEFWARRSLFHGGEAPCLDEHFNFELAKLRAVQAFSETEARSLHFHFR